MRRKKRIREFPGICFGPSEFRLLEILLSERRVGLKDLRTRCDIKSVNALKVHLSRIRSKIRNRPYVIAYDRAARVYDLTALLVKAEVA